MGTQTFTDLVDRQVRAWQEDANRSKATGQGPMRQRPMVTVSREYGALGGTVGKRVAQRLGFQYFDREVVDWVAQRAHVSNAVVASVDERLRDVISNWLAEQFGAGRLAHSDYLHNLGRVVLTAGHHGRGVIMGRCAHLLLDRRWTLTVRVIAPLAMRILNVSHLKKISEADAEARIREIDRARQDFCRRSFGEDIANPGFYDLVLDSGRVPLETCAAIIETAFRGRFPGEATGAGAR